ncbi:hypothetical protein CHUAL_006265 [Chamberlinius hualienensis]
MYRYLVFTKYPSSLHLLLDSGVNREKKKIHRGGQYDDGGLQDYGIIGGNPSALDTSHYGDYELRQPHQHQQLLNTSTTDDGQHGGDSWV